MDPSEPGAVLELPWPCVARLTSFDGWTVPENWTGGKACNLRRLWLWTVMNDREREALEPCTSLEEAVLYSPPDGLKTRRP